MSATGHPSGWFRGKAGRRYGVELGAIVLAKLVLIALLYLLIVAPAPHAGTSPDSMRAHLLEAPAATPARASP